MESSQKTEQWTNNDVASFPYMQISGRPLTGDCLIQLKGALINFLCELQAVISLHHKKSGLKRRTCTLEFVLQC